MLKIGEKVYLPKMKLIEFLVGLRAQYMHEVKVVKFNHGPKQKNGLFGCIKIFGIQHLVNFKITKRHGLE